MYWLVDNCGQVECWHDSILVRRNMPIVSGPYKTPDQAWAAKNEKKRGK